MSSPEVDQVNKYLPILVYAADVNQQQTQKHAKLLHKIKHQIRGGLYDKLDLRGFFQPAVQQSIIKYVMSFRTIRVLEISHPLKTKYRKFFGVEETTQLANFLRQPTVLSSLIFKGIQFSNFGPLAASFVDNASITFLKLDSCDLHSKDVTSLAFALQKNRTLTQLEICNNLEMGNSGLVSIPNLLIANHTFRVLTLQSCCITSWGVQILCQGIKHSALRRITLDANNLSHSFRHLGKAIAAHPTLEVLSVSSCCLQNSDLKEFAVELINSANSMDEIPATLPILTLNLSGNFFEREGIDCLSQGLARSKRQFMLGLEFCNLDVTSITHLCEPLSSTTSLVGLNLSMNPIQDSGATALSEGLENNNSLTELWLEHCAITNIGGLKLSQGLRNHGCLRKLKIQSNPIDMPIQGILDLKVATITMPPLKKLQLGIHSEEESKISSYEKVAELLQYCVL